MKTTKRILSVAASVVLFFSALIFTGCNNEARNNIELTPPFFKVTDESTGAVVYMLGTMHVGKPDTDYPKEVYNALDECDTLAVELDIVELEKDMAALSEAMSLLLCSPGTTAADYMGADYENIKQKFIEQNFYSELYEYYVPALWTSIWSNEMVAQCGYDSELGTDRILLSYAKEKGLKVESIETANEQYQVEANMSPELQMSVLKETVELSDEEMKAQFDELYNCWRIADVDTLRYLAEEESEFSDELKADYEKYYDDMYTNRQKKMADYILDKLKSGGKTFVAVGAMHYAAPPSILDFLTENGYSVEYLYYFVPDA